MMVSEIFYKIYDFIVDVFYWIFNFFLDLNYAAIIEALGTLGPFLIAIVAYKSMNSWIHQKSYDLKYKHLDDLMENADKIYVKFKIMLKDVELIQIGIESYTSTPHRQKYCEGENNGFIHYILKRGIDSSRKLSVHVDEILPMLSILRRQTNKAQYMGFTNPLKSSITSHNFISFMNLIASLGSILTYDENINWEHPEIQKNLSNYSKIKSSDWEKSLERDFEIFMKFYEENMKDLIP